MKNTNVEVLGIIPARGGSKSIPGKNIKILNGKPLIAYSIIHALKVKAMGKVIVSTDDPQIAQIARDYGAEVPFLRPKEIAEDLTPDWPVFIHALEWLEKHQAYIPDIVVHLRPTSPLRKITDIETAIEIMKKYWPDSVVSLSEVTQYPQKMWRIINGAAIRLLPASLNVKGEAESPRQLLEKIYRQNGIVDVIKYDTIVKNGVMLGDNVLPIIINKEYAIDIDLPEDFLAAEEVLKNKN